MGLVINNETNVLDYIFSGDVFVLKEGQTVVYDQINVLDSGELIVPDNASLIFL